MGEEGPKPWERQPYDTQTSWAYFQLYLEQDAPRSINEAYRLHRARRGLKVARNQGAPGSWRNLGAGKNVRGVALPGAISWERRAAAWDDHVAELDRRKWVERRLQLREKEWDLGQKLIEKAQQMLMFPVMAQESADGKTLILPADWKLRDVPAVVAAASKLARLSAEMSTENLNVDWRDEARKAGVSDPDELFRELVDRLEKRLAGEDAGGGLGDGQEESEDGGQ